MPGFPLILLTSNLSIFLRFLLKSVYISLSLASWMGSMPSMMVHIRRPKLSGPVSSRPFELPCYVISANCWNRTYSIMPLRTRRTWSFRYHSPFTFLFLNTLSFPLESKSYRISCFDEDARLLRPGLGESRAWSSRQQKNAALITSVLVIVWQSKSSGLFHGLFSRNKKFIRSSLLALD